MKPGGTIGAHVLTADREFTEKPQLPGPAALVEQVWTDRQTAEFLAEAGFVGVRFTKLGQKPCFSVGDAQLRETKLAAVKPNVSKPEAAESAGGCCNAGPVEVMYKGPLRELRDDFGNVYPRGVRTTVDGAAAQMLAELPQADEMFLFGGDAPAGGCCGA
ncbi:MAG: hypothetical protein QM775_34365 [Pirellulales bacterium]